MSLLKKSLLLIAVSTGVIVFGAEHGQAKPSADMKRCVDIGQPKMGDVCYMTDSKYIRRKEDKDSTRKESIVWERQIDGWVMTHAQAQWRSGGFGSVSGPWVNMVSGSGNIELNETISRSISSLQETKAKLDASIKGCLGSACGDMKNSLDYVNKQINDLNSTRELAISKGNNEAAQISASTYVKHSCTLGICIYGGGVSKNLDYWIYYRYVGSPSAINTNTSEIIANANSAIERSKVDDERRDEPDDVKPDTGKSDRKREIRKCRKRFEDDKKMRKQCIKNAKNS